MKWCNLIPEIMNARPYGGYADRGSAEGIHTRTTDSLYANTIPP
jgi:hypothetical protein